MMAAKERYEKTSRDRQSLAEEVQKQELQLKKALNKRKKALLEKMWVPRHFLACGRNHWSIIFIFRPRPHEDDCKRKRL